MMSNYAHSSRNTIELDEGAPALTVEHKRLLEADTKLKQEKLDEPYLLKWPSVVCIIANRMIGILFMAYLECKLTMKGTGIFLTPSTLIQLTQSVGITLLFWVVGACTTLCGTLMFMEYGLTSPRFHYKDNDNAIKMPLPRSGGDLFYVSHSSLS